MRSVITISDRTAAAAFESARKREIVQTLMKEELTLSALARATRTSLSLLHYHVLNCIDLGLIKVVREQSRRGRGIKYYRATAESFFIPAELIMELPGTKLNETLRDALDLHLTRSLRGIILRHDGIRPRVDLVRETSSKALAMELWLDVGLSAAAASELAGELQAVADRYRSRGEDQEARYLVHLAMVRV